MTENSWFALDDASVAAWEACTRDPLALADAIIRAGEATEVFRVATALPDGSDEQSFDYRRHLRTGVVPFEMAPEEAPRGRRLITPGKICWQESGRIREGDVADLGSLLRRLRPDAVDWAENFMSHVPPVIVWGRGSRVRIELPTDLWFPRILGILDGGGPAPPVPPERDNSVLARCHAPRLNSFLDAIRHAASHWRLMPAEGIATRYADMTDESGIRIEQ